MEIEMAELFDLEVVNKLAAELDKWKSDTELSKLFQGLNPKKLGKLMELVSNDQHKKQIGALIEKSNAKTNLCSIQLDLRELMPNLMSSIADNSESIEISKWIVQEWGGINSGDAEKFQKLIKDAEDRHTKSIPENQVRTFNSYRIASWSKHLAFKYPTQRAVYDAKVIYTLNWLLFDKIYPAMRKGTQSVKYFPFLMGQNSAISMLDYEIYLILRDGKQGSNAVNKELAIDVAQRRAGTRKNSGFAKSARDDSNTFIEEDNAYSEYCTLLQRLSEKLYPSDVKCRLTKTEMILFSIADAEIAKEVLQYITNLAIRNAGADEKQVARIHS